MKIRIPSSITIDLNNLHLMSRSDLVILRKAVHKIIEGSAKKIPKNVGTVVISTLNLSTRTKNVCRYHEINTISDLLKFKQSQLMSLRNFGRICLYELCSELEQFNLKLEE